MLLARDKRGEMPWHQAVTNGIITVLQKIFDWTKELKINQD